MPRRVALDGELTHDTELLLRRGMWEDDPLLPEWTPARDWSRHWPF